MRPRYYSISSSPASASSCHLTVGVLRGLARSGHGTFSGVASGHLESGMEGSTVFTFIRKPTTPFHPPANPHVLMIMIGAGTGMAPFRGFLQDRADLKAKGVPVGESILFFGCRNPESDFLYADELQGFADAGVVDKISALPANAFKPFGTGQRACIGRQFAMQEAILVLAPLLQRFDFIDAFDYELKIKSTLTIKPDEMLIQVRPRPDRRLDAPTAPSTAPATFRAGPAVGQELAPTLPAVDRHNTPLRVLYGSDLGTAEGIATRLAHEGTERGYSVVLGALDDHIGDLPTDGASILVSSSYNGLPPANAQQFCEWLGDPPADDRPTDAAYTVFGCGNTEWAATYQAVPILLDTKLAEHGARANPRPRGGDVRSDFDAQYRTWHDTLWSDLAEALQLPASAADPAVSGPRLSVTIVNRQTTNPVIMSYEAQPALVHANRELATASDGPPIERSTRHVEVALPAGVTYQTGDHLGVLPRNRPDLVRRVMFCFGLDGGQYLTIVARSGSHTHLPIDEPTPLLGVLGTCVELQDVAKRSDIELMLDYTEDPDSREALQQILGEDPEAQARYREQVFLPNRSLLDLLEDYPACAMPFEVYLDLLPPLRRRYYSISSSPLLDAEVCSITTGLVRGPARSGNRVFAGVCSNHLADSPSNSTVFVFVRDPGIGHGAGRRRRARVGGEPEWRTSCRIRPRSPLGSRPRCPRSDPTRRPRTVMMSAGLHRRVITGQRRHDGKRVRGMIMLCVETGQAVGAAGGGDRRRATPITHFHPPHPADSR